MCDCYPVTSALLFRDPGEGPLSTPSLHLGRGHCSSVGSRTVTLSCFGLWLSKPVPLPHLTDRPCGQDPAWSCLPAWLAHSKCSISVQQRHKSTLHPALGVLQCPWSVSSSSVLLPAPWTCSQLRGPGMGGGGDRAPLPWYQRDWSMGARKDPAAPVPRSHSVAPGEASSGTSQGFVRWHQ